MWLIHVTHSYVWHDWWIPVTQLIDSFLIVTWLIHIWECLVHTWHDYVICGDVLFIRDMTHWLIPKRDMTHSYVGMSHSYVKRLIHMWGGLIHTWHDSFICGEVSFIRDMTHLYVGMSRSYVTWLIHMWEFLAHSSVNAMTASPVTYLVMSRFRVRMRPHIWMSHVLFIISQ